MLLTDHAGLIECEGLSKSFGRVKAVDGLGFTVTPGRVTGFLGPNGAGKTTTLRMLLGLVTPDAGTATIGGFRYRDLSRPGDRVGAVLDAAGFHPARSGLDHLRVLCEANGYRSAKAAETLDRVGLTGSGRRAVRGYSLGMRQRLALAGALLGDPAVLVLDEPANGLDPEGITWMRALLRDLADEGRTVLVSSHVLTEMQLLVDRAVIIHKGRLVREGTLAEIAGPGGRVVTVRSPEAVRLASLLHKGSIERPEPDLLRVTGIGAAEVGHLAHANGIELHELSAGDRDLEQVFLALIDGREGGRRCSG